MHQLAKPPKAPKKTPAAARADGGRVFPQEQLKNGSALTAAQAASAELEKLMAAAIAASGCKDKREFDRLPKEDKNAFLSQARGQSSQPVLEGRLEILATDRIRRSPFNREHFDSDELQDLIESVKEHGVIQPAIVRFKPDGKTSFELIAGERRWRAATAAGKDIPVIIREATDEQALELQAIENLRREDLNAIDEATKYEQLIASYTVTHQIGRVAAVEMLEAKLGGKKKTSAIYGRLTLLKLPPKVQELVLTRKLPHSHAELLTKLSDPKTVLEIATAITKPKADIQEADGTMSFRMAEAMVSQARTREKNFAAWQKKAAEFGEKRLQVLTPAEAEKWVGGREDGGYFYVKSGAPFVKADDSCDMPGSNYREYQKLWRTAPPQILGRIPNGGPVIIYDRKLAEEAVKAGGKLHKPGVSNKSVDQQEKEKAHKRRRQSFFVATGEVVTNIENSLDSVTFWRFFATAMLGQWRCDPVKRLCKRRGWGKVDWRAKIQTMTVHELRGVCAEILLYNDVPSDYGSRWGNTIKAACELCQVKLPAWGGDGVQASGDDDEDEI
jgi:ParB family chromosome partitioning protein